MDWTNYSQFNTVWNYSNNSSIQWNSFLFVRSFFRFFSILGIIYLYTKKHTHTLRRNWKSNCCMYKKWSYVYRCAYIYWYIHMHIYSFGCETNIWLCSTQSVLYIHRAHIVIIVDVSLFTTLDWYSRSAQGKKEKHLSQLYADQFQRVYYKTAIECVHAIWHSVWLVILKFDLETSYKVTPIHKQQRDKTMKDSLNLAHSTINTWMRIVSTILNKNAHMAALNINLNKKYKKICH